MTIEERVQRLEDIEAIRQLQAKYQRCLDTRDFDTLAECFTDDIDATYDNARESYNGKQNVLDFLYSVMTVDIPSSHLIHGGEINVLSSTTAQALWYLEDYLLHRKFFVKLHGTAIYDVCYRVEGSNGSREWKISKIGYTRCYEYFERRSILNLLTLGKMTFLEAFKRKPRRDLNKQQGLTAHLKHFKKKNK